LELTTNNEELDVLILYGFSPPTIYASGNTEPDESLAEKFIETHDGDVIINHADWMFYVSTPTNNGIGGLQNMMDNMDIVLWYDNTPMSVTPEGSIIAPSLTDLLSDRPIPVGVLQDDWFIEATLAENADGTLAEPVILRDGNRGRLIPVYQTASQPADPKGAVAAEIIIWLMENASGETGGPLFVRGDANSDGRINLTDGISILSFLFLGKDEPNCLDAADADNNSDLNLTDAVKIFSWLFTGGAVPPDPSPSAVEYQVGDCGPDPTIVVDPEKPPSLGCAAPSCKCGSFPNCIE
jgi:hypothetical protein